MTQFSFKSVGRTSVQKIEEVIETSRTPFGIKTPLRYGGQDGLFEMTYSLVDQVNDNLRNLLLTNWGERVALYDFGANLRPLTTEYTTQDDFDNAAFDRIKAAVERWMPYVSLDSYESSVERRPNLATGIVRLAITYDVNALSVKGKKLELSLYII